ncbi:MAG: hypothetical protein ABL998_04825 [Planctomycetota bacterium]
MLVLAAMHGFLVLWFFLLQLPAAPGEPLVSAALRTRWRTVTTEAARTGDAELVRHLRAILVELGDPADELARLDSAWERALAAAKPARDARSGLARRIERELPALAAELERLEGERRATLAHCLLALDPGQPAAQAVLGRERDDDGEWLSAEERAWKAGERRVTHLEQEARALTFDFAEGASDNPTLAALGGGRVLGAHGVEVHSALPPAVLERVLAQALRAMAFSRALLDDTPRPPRVTGSFVLLESEEAFERALSEAVLARGVSGPDADEARRQRFRSYHDARGWRTIRWRPEAELAAILAWELSPAWLGTDAQPCLTAGHLNSVCLRMLGTPVPLVAWKDTSASGAAERSRSALTSVVRESLWRCARRSFQGCRAWLVRAARAGTDPAWTRAMVDHEGKLGGEALLKATMVSEFLQAEGRFRELLELTRARRDVPAAMESALGETLPEFEARWRRWLDPARATSVLALLRAPAAGASTTFDAALLALSQARANANKGTPLEFPLVAQDDELARGAAAHARYLVLNPKQQDAWPDAHQEFPDRPGYSAEGARAGANAMLARTSAPPEAVRQWLATFYHRLPLLDPGLVGVGFAQEGELVVADVHSLVLDPSSDHVALWPMPDALDVPRAFQPELPNPVPGSDMASLGYPLTVQLFFVDETTRVTLELELWKGKPEDGKRVVCHFLTPEAALFAELAPTNAWGLIPERALEPRTSYTAVARWGQETRRWSFTTEK